MSKDWIGCIAWLALGTGALLASADLQVMTRFGPGPGLFVRGLAMLMIALAGVQALSLFWTRIPAGRAQPTADNPAAILGVDEGEGDRIVRTRTGLVRFGILVTTLFGYGLVLEQIGFIISTAVLAFVAMTVLGRPLLRSAIEALVAVVLAQLLFGYLLGVNLPDASLAPLAALGF